MARTDVRDAALLYRQAQQLRSPHDQQFRMNAAYCLPRDYARWQGATAMGEDRRTSSDVQARFAFDNTGIRAVAKYGAICKRLINPDNIKYHRVTADNDDLMRTPQVREYFDQLTDILFRKRLNPAAGYGTAQQEVYTSIGVYGTGPKSTKWNKEYRTFSYKAWPLYNMFFIVDDEGRVCHAFRRFALSKYEFGQKFPGAPIPKVLANKQDSDIASKAEFVHHVYKRNDYDPKALGPKRMKWSSNYFVAGDSPEYIGDEEGALSCVYQMPRTMTVAGDVYGYSPAELAFPSLGGVNAMKKTYIKMGHKAVDPPLLAHDDGVLSGRIDMRPGRVTYNAINGQGQALVRELQTGSNFAVAEQLVADERNDINDSFLVTLFQILTDTPEMTAAEVYERVAEKAALFAPTMAALQEQDQGPQVEREIALLAEYGELPPMPPELVEAKGEYKVSYTNPMNKALHATEVSGFMRWSEMLANAANITGDPSPMDHINWDAAAPDIGDKMDVRARYINTPEIVAQKREARAKQMEQEMMLKAAPAAASVAATAAKTEQGGARR